MTEITDDMMPVNSKICRTCKYGCVFDGKGYAFCDYYLMTGIRRKCPAGWCNHYEKLIKGQKRKKKEMMSYKLLKEDTDEW